MSDGAEHDDESDEQADEAARRVHLSCLHCQIAQVKAG
jgi:hypothetical protein